MSNAQRDNVEQYREEYEELYGVQSSNEVDERLTVVITNSVDADSEWTPVSLHETADEAEYVAGEFRADGHGAETVTLPLYRHTREEHTGTTNIGQKNAETEAE